MLLTQHVRPLRVPTRRPPAGASWCSGGLAIQQARQSKIFQNRLTRMAIFHLNARVVSRANGHSAVAKAAYIARTALKDERLDWALDYSAKDGLLFAGIFTPKAAPAWAQERAELWNGAEAAEARKDATIAREYEIGLPHELTLEQNRWLVQDFVKENFTRQGYAADVAIHAADPQGDPRNIHAHILVTDRRLEADGFAADKKERQGTAAEREARFEAIRESWERHANHHLERHGFDARIDRRSLAAQGLDREPTRHLGPRVVAMQRRGLEPNRYAELKHAFEPSELTVDLVQRRGELAEVERAMALETARTRDPDAPRVAGRFALDRYAALDEERQKQQQIRAAAEAKQAQRHTERAHASAGIRDAWQASGGQGLDFMLALAERGLHLAHEDGRFCVVADNGLRHGFGAQTKPIRRALADMQREHGGLIVPTVDECRQDLRASRYDARQAQAAAARQAKQESWQPREVAASTDLRPEQGDLRLLYRLAPSGRDFAAALEDQDLHLARVTAQNARDSEILHALARHDQTRAHAPPVLREGEVVLVNRYGHAVRLGLRLTGDTRAGVDAKLADLDRAALPTLDEARTAAREARAHDREARERARQQRAARTGATLYDRAGMASMQRDAWRDIRHRQPWTGRPLSPAERQHREDEEQRRQQQQQEQERLQESRKGGTPEPRDARAQARADQRDRTEQSEARERKEAMREWQEMFERSLSEGRSRERDDGGGGRTRSRE
jgi:hypothetical protein